MSGDEIVEEVHRIREKIAQKYNYNVSAIVSAAMKSQWKSGHKVVSFDEHRQGPSSVKQGSRRATGSRSRTGQ